jgi:soluble calcium-activated nucleotidase 1
MRMRGTSWRVLVRRHPGATVLFCICLFLLVIVVPNIMKDNTPNSKPSHVRRYMYQQNYSKYNSKSAVYNISVVADKDKASKSSANPHVWESILLEGVLMRDEYTGLYSVSWKNSITLKSSMNEGGRGMELSDLVYFNGKLFTCDDRTGIVYNINKEEGDYTMVPMHILSDGDGQNAKGFKCEWLAVKDDVLYVGGLGKEWTNEDGEVVSRDPQWVKTITASGEVGHMSWVHVYEALRAATGTLHPGYLIHEAVRFHPAQRRWIFLPRRASTEPYVDTLDEKRGADLLISTNEHFEDVQVKHIGTLIPTHGFSSFVILPFREDEIVALKTEEFGDTIATYMTVFTLDGQILLEEETIGDVKFEGIEIL